MLRFMSYVKKGGIIAYLFTIIIAILFDQLDLELINTMISTILEILYFIILTCALFSFYSSKKKNIISIFLFFLPIFILITGIPFRVVTMILVLPLFF